MGAIPRRQKILMLAVIIGGVIFLYCSAFEIVEKHRLAVALIFYALIPPIWLQSDEMLLDLDKREVFLAWLFLAIIQFAFYLEWRTYPVYDIRNHEMPHTSINVMISGSTVGSMKALLVFLIFYFLFNKLNKRITGFPLVSTSRKSNWYSDEAKREITGYDVLFNILLLFITGCACIFD
ncbi:MAG TPA: hypothetical protein VL651_14910 [Bacteroidia bacterium]|jgi:hypothetical protein|nr:hypothetical protein [Bacteroidia bacterium]